MFAFSRSRTFLVATINGELAGSMSVGDEISYDTLAKEHPQDVQVQVSVAEDTPWNNSAISYAYEYDATSIYGGEQATTQKLSKLVDRFPTSALPCADYLRLALGWMRDSRLAGDFENPKPPPYKQPSPEHTRYTPGGGSLPTFKRAQLQRALTIAHHGQRLEPDNAYFDWVLVCLLLAAERDGEALQTLHAGSLKGHYDDHSLESIRAALHTSELARPMPLEYTLPLCETNLGSLHNYYNHAAKLLSWRAWKAERAGQHKAAIALRADLARLAHLLLRDTNTVETQQFAGKLQLIAWMGNPPRTITYSRNLALLLKDVNAASVRSAQSFAAYARGQGAPSEAREAIQFAQDSVTLSQTLQRTGYDATITSVPFHNDTLFTLYNQIRTLFWFGAGVLCQIPLLVAGYIALSSLLIRTARAPDENARRAFPVALLCFGLLLSAGLLLLPTILRSDTEELRGYNSPTISQITRETIRLVSGVALFFITPYILPAWAWSFNAWRQRRTWLRTQPPARESPLIPRDMRPWVWGFLLSSVALATFAGLGLALVVWLRQSSRIIVFSAGLGISCPEENLAPILLAISAGAALLWLVGWLLKWRFFVAREERPIFHGALRRYRLTFGTLLLINSWAYLLLFWLSLIPRHHAEKLLGQTLREGVAVKITPGNLLKHDRKT